MTASLPPIITSVARLIPSISEWRQPYLLSNLLLVTESLTLIAGNSSSPRSANWYRRCTPVVVSSVTPLISAAILVKRCESSSSERWSSPSTISNSSESALAGSGTAPARSNSAPLWTSSVASPPSSRIMFGRPWPVLRARTAPAGCTTSTPRASRPSTRNTGTPWGSSGVPAGPDDDRRGRVVLGREDVARRPADLRSERHERLDQHRGLDRHVQRAGDPRAGSAAGARRTRAGSPSAPASRARRGGSPCGRTRPTQDRPP